MPLFFFEPLIRRTNPGRLDNTRLGTIAPQKFLAIRARRQTKFYLYIQGTRLKNNTIKIYLSGVTSPTLIAEKTLDEKNIYEIRIPDPRRLNTPDARVSATIEKPYNDGVTPSVNEVHIVEDAFELPDNQTFTKIERRLVERGAISQHNLYQVLTKIPGTHKREVSYTAQKLSPDKLKEFEEFRVNNPVFFFREDKEHFPRFYPAVFQNVFLSRWTSRFKGTGLSLDFTVVER